MTSFRNILFQIHLWTGLVVGIFFILLGLSGSALVYPQLLAPSAAPVPTTTAQGAPLPLEQIIAAARAGSPQSDGRSATLTLPRNPGEAVTVQFNAQRGGDGRGRGGRGGRRGGDRAGGGRNGGRDGGAEGRGGRGAPSPALFIDPVSGQVLGTRTQGPSSLTGLAHEMHESMLLGASGRMFVGLLGVGMLFLGLSGLYLWWPKAGQWKYAFGVRRNARGFRLYREIHGMFGIWFWLVFIVVTATGIPLGLPFAMAMISGQRQGGPLGPGGPPPGFGAPQAIEAPDGASPLPLTRLIADAEKSSGGKAVSISVPAQPDRAVTVNMQGDGDRPHGIALNPYTAEVIAAPERAPGTSINRGAIEQLHGGQNMGPVWRFLVFLSGFLPLIFVTTGLMMWIRKRQQRPAAQKGEN